MRTKSTKGTKGKTFILQAQRIYRLRCLGLTYKEVEAETGIPAKLAYRVMNSPRGKAAIDMMS